MSEKVDEKVLSVLRENHVEIPEVVADDEYHEAVKVLGATETVSYQDYMRFAEKNGLILIRTPHLESYYGKGMYHYGFPIETVTIKKWLGTDRTVTKLLEVSKIDDYLANVGSLPKAVIMRAAKIVKQSNSFINGTAILHIVNGNFKLLRADPILLGFHSKENKDSEYHSAFYHLSQNRIEYAFILGMWGSDLEEIDMALIKNTLKRQ